MNTPPTFTLLKRRSLVVVVTSALNIFWLYSNFYMKWRAMLEPLGETAYNFGAFLKNPLLFPLVILTVNSTLFIRFYRAKMRHEHLEDDNALERLYRRTRNTFLAFNIPYLLVLLVSIVISLSLDDGSVHH